MTLFKFISKTKSQNNSNNNYQNNSNDNHQNMELDWKAKLKETQHFKNQFNLGPQQRNFDKYHQFTTIFTINIKELCDKLNLNDHYLNKINFNDNDYINCHITSHIFLTIEGLNYGRTSIDDINICLLKNNDTIETFIYALINENINKINLVNFIKKCLKDESPIIKVQRGIKGISDNELAQIIKEYNQ